MKNKHDDIIIDDKKINELATMFFERTKDSYNSGFVDGVFETIKKCDKLKCCGNCLKYIHDSITWCSKQSTSPRINICENWEERE